MIHVGMGAKDIPGIESAVLIHVQQVIGDELPQIGRAHILLLRPQGVLQIEAVHAELVGRDDHHVVRHAAGHQ